MAETWTLLSLEIFGAAKRGRVRHRMSDGTERIREYGWPATLTRDQLIRTLDALHAQVLAEPPAPPVDDAMDLIGQPREA